MGKLLAKGVLDYSKMREHLRDSFAVAEDLFRADACPPLPNQVESALKLAFSSSTQAYREVLVGCLLVSLDAPSLDIRSPYVGLSDNSYNGRTLDEDVVNPYLQAKRVPSSRGPYLSVFRRSVGFVPATRDGLRDKLGYDAVLEVIGYVVGCPYNLREGLFLNLLCKFVELRQSSSIALSKLNRVSVTQYERLITGLLKVPSGGRVPVIIVVSILYALKAHFSLNWEIHHQGINEADSAAGAGGDVTVKHGGEIVLAAEITERPVDKSRVVATFNTKISPAAIRDYIFFVNNPSATAEAVKQANQYFAQGSEVNFVDIQTWATMTLVTMGYAGRDAFNEQATSMLDANDIPRTIKVAWNDLVATVTSI